MENVKELELLNAEDDLIDQLISDWTFYLPSPELTKLILVQNDKLGSEYFNEKFETNMEVREANSTISQSLQKAFDILFHRSEPKQSETEEEVISGFQAFFSERIFNHLALLSRTSYAKKGTFSIREELTIELAEKIGLGLYLDEKTSLHLRTETENILLSLANEFQKWFIGSHNGIFRTVWGSIFSVDQENDREAFPGNSVILVPDV